MKLNMVEVTSHNLQDIADQQNSVNIRREEKRHGQELKKLTHFITHFEMDHWNEVEKNWKVDSHVRELDFDRSYGGVPIGDNEYTCGAVHSPLQRGSWTSCVAH